MEGRGNGERACESGYFRACGLLWTSGKVPLVAHACSSSCGTVGSMRTSTYPGCKFLRACAAVAFWIGKQKGGKCLSCCASPSSVTLAHGEEDEKKHPRRRSLEGWANLGAFTAPVWRVWRMRPLDEGHAGGETDGSCIAKKWTASYGRRTWQLEGHAWRRMYRKGVFLVCGSGGLRGWSQRASEMCWTTSEGAPARTSAP